MFTDTNLHLCILTPDPIMDGTNQHAVYHSVSCSKLLLSKLIKVFCISVIFRSKGKQSACYRRLYMSKMIQKMISLNFKGLLQHSTWFLMSPARHAISTRWMEDNILQTLNDAFGKKADHLTAYLGQNTIEHVS